MKITSIASDEEILQKDNEYCSFGDTVHYSEIQPIFRDCNGCFMYDGKDTPFLDLQMWFASCNLGYKNPQVNNAVIDQINTMPQIASKFTYDYKVLLAEKIVKANLRRFGEKGRAHFNVGGAQANEDMLKMARNYTKKNSFFAFMGGYHGRTLGTTAVTSSFRYREQYGHFGDRAHFVPFPYCYRCYYGKCRENCNLYCVKQFAKLFESEYHAVCNPTSGECECKAFIAEPILGTGGYVIPPEGYFKALKKVLDEHNILLLIDEIQMGCYRTGKLWAIEHFQVTPDAISFGKSLTNGLNPLGGFWAKEKLISPSIFPAGSTHSTYSSNPIGTRAGYEVMGIFEKNNFEEMIKNKGQKFLNGLKELKQKYKNIGNVDGLGFALRIEITEKDRFTPNKKLCTQIIEEGLKGNLIYNNKKCGLILNTGGYYKNVITLVPSLYMTNDEIDMALELLDQLFKRFD